MLCFRKFLVAKKFMDKKGGEYHNFPSEYFCLTVPKNFVGEPFSVSLISGIEKFYASESYVTIFCRNFLSHSAEKFRRGTLLCCVFRKFLVAKKTMEKREGEVSRFPSKNFCLTLPKKFVGEPLGCH